MLVRVQPCAHLFHFLPPTRDSQTLSHLMQCVRLDNLCLLSIREDALVRFQPTAPLYYKDYTCSHHELQSSPLLASNKLTALVTSTTHMLTSILWITATRRLSQVAAILSLSTSYHLLLTSLSSQRVMTQRSMIEHFTIPWGPHCRRRYLSYHQYDAMVRHTSIPHPYPQV